MTNSRHHVSDENNIFGNPLFKIYQRSFSFRKIPAMLNLARLVSRPISCLRSAIPALPSPSSSLPTVSFSSFGQSRSLPSPSAPSTNCLSSSLLLQAASPLLVQSCGIKHMGKLQKRCRHCYYAIKDEQKYVMCTANPR